MANRGAKVVIFFDIHKKSAIFIKNLHLTITSFRLACSLSRPKRKIARNNRASKGLRTTLSLLYLTFHSHPLCFSLFPFSSKKEQPISLQRYNFFCIYANK